MGHWSPPSNPLIDAAKQAASDATSTTQAVVTTVEPVVEYTIGATSSAATNSANAQVLGKGLTFASEAKKQLLGNLEDRISKGIEVDEPVAVAVIAASVAIIVAAASVATTVKAPSVALALQIARSVATVGVAVTVLGVNVAVNQDRAEGQHLKRTLSDLEAEILRLRTGEAGAKSRASDSQASRSMIMDNLGRAARMLAALVASTEEGFTRSKRGTTTGLPAQRSATTFVADAELAKLDHAAKRLRDFALRKRNIPAGVMQAAMHLCTPWPRVTRPTFVRKSAPLRLS